MGEEDRLGWEGCDFSKGWSGKVSLRKEQLSKDPEEEKELATQRLWGVGWGKHYRRGDSSSSPRVGACGGLEGQQGPQRGKW